MKRVGIFFAACAVLSVVPVASWAEEAAPGGGHGGSGGLPQMDVALFPGMLFWAAVSFALFFLVMRFIGVPGVQQTQAKRAEALGSDLAAARAASEEAQSVVVAYEEALSSARQQAQGAVNEILVEAAKEAEINGEKLQKELTHRTKVAVNNIATARQKAMEEAPKYVNELVLDLFDRVVKVKMGAKG